MDSGFMVNFWKKRVDSKWLHGADNEVHNL